MDKQSVVHTYNRILVIKGNAFESVLVTWMNGQPITYSSKSEKNK